MSDSRRRPSVLSEASWISGSFYLAQLLFFIRGLFLARLLGQFDFGVWTSMRVVRDLGRYLPLGAAEGMEQLAPYAHASGRRAEAGRIRSVACGAVLLVGIAAAGVIAAWAMLRSESTAMADRRVEWVVFAVVFLLTQLYFFGFAVLRTIHRFRSLSVIMVTVAACSTLGILVIPRFGLFGFLVVVALSYGLGVGILAILPPRVRPELGYETGIELVRTGFPIMGAEFLGSLQWNLDKLFLWAFLGSAELGVYALSVHLIYAVMIFPKSAAAVLYPRLREQQGLDGSIDVQGSQLRQVTHFLAGVTIPALGVLWIGLEYLVLIAFPDYLDAVAPGRILLVGACLPVIAGLSTPVLVARGQQKLLAATRLLGLAATALVLYLVATGEPGLVWVAGATALGLSLQAASAGIAALAALQVSIESTLRIAVTIGLGLVAMTAGLVGILGLHPRGSLESLTLEHLTASAAIGVVLVLWILAMIWRETRQRSG